jgi:hypothetical protein
MKGAIPLQITEAGMRLRRLRGNPPAEVAAGPLLCNLSRRRKKSKLDIVKSESGLKLLS